MTSIEILAPAKVNLFLKVLNKRKDSYHNILTVFERISLFDKIKISRRPNGIQISSDKYITKEPKDNLAYKAARLIMRHKKLKGGVKIYIKKTIPIASGLGGGSSDAAAVLVGINRLYNLKFKKETLMRLGGRIGADVPFFILNKSFAVGRSRGDKLEAIDSKMRFWHLLICPNFKLSAKEIYDTFDEESLPKHLTIKESDVKIKSSLGHSMDFGTAESMLHNDLEDIVIEKSGIVGRIRERLVPSLGKKILISGSGPSLFCLYVTRKEAVRAKMRFTSRVPARERISWQVFIVRTC